MVYVDDILIIDKAPHKYMLMIQEDFTVKKDSIETPKTYLELRLVKLNTLMAYMPGQWVQKCDNTEIIMSK